MKPIKFLQISDMHIFGDPTGSLLGVQTLPIFEKTIEMISQYPDQPDFILVTGDISQDGTPASYENAKLLLSQLKIPVHCLPGNHDDPTMMKNVFDHDTVKFTRTLQLPNWNFIMLDSTIPKSNKGKLSPSELDFLRGELTAHPETHTIVTFHHNPMALQSQWLDAMTIENSDEFLSCIKPFSQIKAVLFGHVHQEYDAHHEGVRFLGSPSTCVQFKPRCDKFTVDVLPPGFRWIELTPDGKINTDVKRMSSVPDGLQLNSTGY